MLTSIVDDENENRWSKYNCTACNIQRLLCLSENNPTNCGYAKLPRQVGRSAAHSVRTSLNEK